jgi:diketogulonate reductase-like aldo/keto reductase
VKYEWIDGLQLPKIGFGTWSIGGRPSPDRPADPRSLEALRSALTLGYRHFDTAEMYAGGHSEELLGQAMRDVGVPRGQVFLTSKVSAEHLRFADTLKACERSLRRLGVDYLDLYLIHWPNPQLPLSETFRALNELVRAGRVRRIGVSNFDLNLLKQARQLSSTPVLTDQVPYSLRERTYSRNGVLEYCQQNGILLTAYTPFEVGGLQINANLASVAKAHRATDHQIALAWLAAQPRVTTIPMSHDPGHQRENLAAADIELSPNEMAQLN